MPARNWIPKLADEPIQDLGIMSKELDFDDSDTIRTKICHQNLKTIHVPFPSIQHVKQLVCWHEGLKQMYVTLAVTSYVIHNGLRLLRAKRQAFMFRVGVSKEKRMSSQNLYTGNAVQNHTAKGGEKGEVCLKCGPSSHCRFWIISCLKRKKSGEPVCAYKETCTIKHCA